MNIHNPPKRRRRLIKRSERETAEDNPLILDRDLHSSLDGRPASPEVESDEGSSSSAAERDEESEHTEDDSEGQEGDDGFVVPDDEPVEIFDDMGDVKKRRRVSGLPRTFVWSESPENTDSDNRTNPDMMLNQLLTGVRCQVDGALENIYGYVDEQSVKLMSFTQDPKMLKLVRNFLHLQGITWRKTRLEIDAICCVCLRTYECAYSIFMHNKNIGFANTTCVERAWFLKDCDTAKGKVALFSLKSKLLLKDPDYIDESELDRIQMSLLRELRSLEYQAVRLK